jgi:hypothetical protein
MKYFEGSELAYLLAARGASWTSDQFEEFLSRDPSANRNSKHTFKLVLHHFAASVKCREDVDGKECRREIRKS